MTDNVNTNRGQTCHLQTADVNSDWLDEVFYNSLPVDHIPSKYLKRMKQAILQHEQQAIANYISQLELPEKRIAFKLPLKEYKSRKAIFHSGESNGWNDCIKDTTAIRAKAVEELRSQT